MSRKNGLAPTAGALLVMSAFGPVWGQEAPAAATQVAAAGEAQPLVLETVTVTARRRSEEAQSVPAPISVVSGQQLEAQGIYQVQDLQQVLPNVSSQFLHARQSSVAVRGIGNNTANEGLEGSVGLYLDNVFLGRPGQAVFDLLDLAQIELLRGPQGTLFGKNTTAGVLNISTRLPTFVPEGSIEASLGNRGTRQLKGSYSAPVSDTVALRVSAYGTHDDGWLKNLQDNRRFDEINRQGVRAQVLVKQGADFSLRLIAEHNEEQSSTGTLVPYSYAPLSRGTAGNNLASNPTTYAAWAVARGATQVITNPYDYNVSIDAEQQANVHQSAFSAEANWNLGGYRLTSVTAWRDWNFSPLNDLDGTNLASLTGGFKTKEDQYSQEFRLASPTGGFQDYVVGAYFYRQKASSYNHYETGPLAVALSGGAYPNNNLLSGNGQATTDSQALFGQDTLHLTPEFDLTGGLRLTSERKAARIAQNDLAVLPSSPPVFASLPIFAHWDSGDLSRKDNSAAALLNTSWKAGPGVLAYATLSHGEKSGGYNVNSVGSVGSAFGVDAVTIQPEKADNLDLGVKTTWWDNRLRVNGNLFVTKVRDYQAVTSRFYAATQGNIGVLTNVGDLTSKGLEFDVRARVAQRLTLNLNGAYTHATFDSGTAPAPYEVFNDVGNPASPLQGYGKGVRSIAGNWVNGAPKWTVNLGGQYRHPAGDAGEPYLNANWSWRSETFGDINNSSYSRIPSYGIANLAAGWRVAQGGGQWDLSIWVKNVTDKHHFLGLTSLNNNAYAASAGQPRTVGASVRYDL
jgi:iron complex outermembrane receptor protein